MTTKDLVKQHKKEELAQMVVELEGKLYLAREEYKKLLAMTKVMTKYLPYNNPVHKPKNKQMIGKALVWYGGVVLKGIYVWKDKGRLVVSTGAAQIEGRLPDNVHKVVVDQIKEQLNEQ